MRNGTDTQAKKPASKLGAYKSSLTDPRDDIWSKIVRHRDRLKTFDTPRRELNGDKKPELVTH